MDDDEEEKIDDFENEEYDENALVDEEDLDDMLL